MYLKNFLTKAKGFLAQADKVIGGGEYLVKLKRYIRQLLR